MMGQEYAKYKNMGQMLCCFFLVISLCFGAYPTALSGASIKGTDAKRIRFCTLFMGL